MSASSSTDKPATSPPPGATSQQKTKSSSSNVARLQAVEEMTAALTERVNRFGEYSRRQDAEMTAATKLLDEVDRRVHTLEASFADHLVNDNQWWRKCICSIIEDIETLRKAKAKDRSPAHGI